jgi:23S rRNA (uracil1939-C5)-methyltransferase
MFMSQRIFQENPLCPGDTLEVEMERLAYGGDGVARHEGLAIFVPLAAPGERLRVRVTERKKNYARAVIEEIIRPSGLRREPLCPYFGQCGGCQLQHISYRAQLDAKADFIRESLKQMARIDWTDPIEIRHSEEYGYRTRAGFKVEKVGEKTIVGFNRASSHAVCDIEICPVLVADLNRALILLRSRVASGLATSREVEAAAGDSSFSFDPQIENLPAGLLTRRVGEFVYYFAPAVFFQSNAYLLEEFVGEITGAARGELAIDLYAGVGLFTLPLTRAFKRVIGIESDKAAYRFAVHNLKANKIDNAEFHCEKVEAWLGRFAQRKRCPRPDVILLDPPRTGAARAVEAIIALSARRVIYVSCDPVTLARDIRKFVDAGYNLSTIKGFDLFPQTYHVEAVTVLDRR